MEKELINLINTIPKAELHIHLEGSIEPEMMLSLAEKNKINLKYKTIDELKKAYNFDDLRDFLYVYTQGTRVLRTAEDFYKITKAYLEKSHSQNILHTEIFIDFQTYARRGMISDIIMDGVWAAIKESEQKLGISSYLILAFLRHLGAKSAMKTLEEGLRYKDKLIGIGLASTEIGYPPHLFKKVFAEARKHGFKTTAHAGEEGPAQYVRESIEILKVDRIDHGNKAMDDPELVKMIVDKQIPLTLCPLSNIALGNVKDLKHHTLMKKLDMGMLVSVNSDDPAYFGGYVNENIIAVTEALNL
ncbi:MAG TPA: adenosine deaminase, partial [Bacteroidetes bacterium]|nr:adenosine deaminase [Bacteroidota bacterium]